MAIFIHFTTTLWTAAHYRIPFINHRLLTFWNLTPCKSKEVNKFTDWIVLQL